MLNLPKYNSLDNCGNDDMEKSTCESICDRSINN